MDVSADFNGLLDQFLKQVMDIARQRYQELPKQRQEALGRMYMAHLMDKEILPMPSDYKNFEHFLSNMLMKKKEHSFRKWLEQQGYQTKKTKPGQFKVIGYQKNA